MVIATLGAVVADYRVRMALAPARVAEMAGITEAQYRALELGTAWPGGAAVQAVIDALKIPHTRRLHFQPADSSLDRYLSQILHGYDIPALIVDSEWRTVEANCYAQRLLPGSATPGWSLPRWILHSNEARERLANWQQVAQCVADLVREELGAGLDNPELRDLDRAASRYCSGPDSGSDPHDADSAGHLLTWRTDTGPFPATACLISVPTGRPDLRQVTLIPRGTQPGHPLLDAKRSQPWDGPLLIDLLNCGVCGLLLTGGGTPATYHCATGCLPAFPADALESRVAQEVVPRVFGPDECRQLAVAQESLTADGFDMTLNVPVTAKHALDQWSRSMTDTQRRGILTSAVRSVTMYGSSDCGDWRRSALRYAWRDFI
ncbi:XRE family transcriptional regulator (plasmid) [Streptomyces sp. NBC_01298]|uniref:MmyB family transcriptional regulator n=1 Tax=Streptomyces sp. NBC_01298 TaxID=2903817 RepID=UPI002E0E34FA|nr:XRE family transcriptional regulator [Streptomyces sp. NBC_01298]